LELINEELKIAIPVLEDYQTLGGFIMYHLQKIPEPGELFSYQNLEFQILSTDGPRLDQVLISILVAEDSSSLDTEDSSALPGYERHSV
ncbi:MAG TPA: transporter associated domain-containing protein, partial [Stenomitos sp.]